MKESASLFYREGSADKVYHAQLEPVMGDDGKPAYWMVNFQYGRRGSTLATGNKTPGGVSYEKAKGIYDKLIKEKMAKGYTPYEGGTPYASSDKAGQVSGLLPQLLNPVDEYTAETLVNAPNYCAQEKFDGKRILIRKKGERVEGINRKGLIVALPERVRMAVACMNFTSVTGQICDSFIIDGESIGDKHYAFDILEAKHDLRQMPYELRYLALSTLCDLDKMPDGFPIEVVKTAWTPDQKRELLAELKARKAEGVVFKEVNATYTIGRPNSGGPQLKHKFYATCSAMVESVNMKRSVNLQLYTDESCEEFQSVGSVTIPPNHEVPEDGDVVEIRYLYAYRGGSIYQPVYLGKRDDISHDDCQLSQLKFKPEGEEEA